MMENSNRRFHNQIGDEYDLFRLASPFHEELQEGIAEELKVNAASCEGVYEVVEIGFGTAITSKVILLAGDNIHLSAVDNEPLMLSKAEEALQDFPSERFNLAIVDAVVFMSEIEDNSIDSVVSAFVIHNMPQAYKISLLKEMYRVLKPGGLFVDGDKIADTDMLKHQADLDWQMEQFKIFEDMGRPELRKEWMDHYVEDEGPDRIMVENAFLEALHDFGFQDVRLIKRWKMDVLVVARK